MLSRLSNFAYRYRKTTVAVWIVILIGLNLFSGRVGTSYTQSLTLPDSESKVANTLLESFQPATQQGGSTSTAATTTSTDTSTSTTTASTDTSTSSSSKQVTQFRVVFASTESALTQTQVDPVIAAIDAVTNVSSIQTPFGPGGTFSKDGKIAVTSVTLDVDRRMSTTTIREIFGVADKYRSSTFQIEFLGGAVSDAETTASSSSEAIGLGIAAIVLFLTFGSLVSALTPIFIAIVAVGSSTAAIGLLSNSFDISDNGPILGALMGLSVGIDYALFIVTRFRKEIKNGNDVKTSLDLAMKTSGRAVLYAGMIVCVAVLGLFAVRISVLDGLAISASVAVLFSLISAMTLLPAVLSLLGARINRLALPHRRDRKVREGEGWWARVAGTVARRPWTWLVSVSMVLLVLCVPALSIQLGETNSGSNAKGTTTRTAYDLVTSAFGAGSETPLSVVVKVPSTATSSDLQTVTDAIGKDSGVASVTQVTMDQSGELATFTVYPTTDGEDEKTSELIARLRGTTIPDAVGDSGLTAYIGGSTAGWYDLATTVQSRLGTFIGAVVFLSMLFLLVLFRSIAIPIKSALMNMLSIGAAFGVVTAVFQWGWGASYIGAAVGPIEPFVPVLMFAILFGLSMDYEVFLVSKIHEEYLKSHDNSGSVRRGIESSAGIITAAASIMFAVFLAFVLSDMRIIQELAIGLAAAIVIDATLVRSIVVPALMQLLGDRNWWLPTWLAKRLPVLSHE